MFSEVVESAASPVAPLRPVTNTVMTASTCGLPRMSWLTGQGKAHRHSAAAWMPMRVTDVVRAGVDEPCLERML